MRYGTWWIDGTVKTRSALSYVDAIGMWANRFKSEGNNSTGFEAMRTEMILSMVLESIVSAIQDEVYNDGCFCVDIKDS